MSENDIVWCGFCNDFVRGESFPHHMKKHVEAGRQDVLRRERARRNALGRKDRLSRSSNGGN